MICCCCPISELKMKDNSVITQNITSIINDSEQIPTKAKIYIEDFIKTPSFSNTIEKKVLENSFVQDVVDDPKSSEGETLVNDPIFEIMKSKENRLDSYLGRWPLSFIEPEDLAKAGFFYLQLDDKVQCAFCMLVLQDWKYGEDPVEEHIKNFPTCPFMRTVSRNTQKVYQQKNIQSSNYYTQNVTLPSTSSCYKPKFPHFADVKNRLSSFTNWSTDFPSAKDLAENGFFYTGKKDIVMCFSCAGSLGYWEPSDQPAIEHAKMFPNCSYLHLLQQRYPFQNIRQNNSVYTKKLSNAGIKQKSTYQEIVAEELLKSVVVKQAKEIFSPKVIENVVFQYLKETGQKFTSLHQLCEKVLEYDDKEMRIKSNSTQDPPDDKGKSRLVANHVNTSEDVLLCKICMDKEKGSVFQPCGHLVACESCASVISECPLCRYPIESRIRTYVS